MKGGTGLSPIQFIMERCSLITCQISLSEAHEGLYVNLFREVLQKEEGCIFLQPVAIIPFILYSSSMLFNFCARKLLEILVFMFMLYQPIDLIQSEARLSLVF